jgi:hypothetical protein
MPKRIQLPDGNIGEFPDSMDDNSIKAVLQKKFPKSSSSESFQTVPMSPPGVMKARPQGPIQTPMNWLEDLRTDVKRGTDLTLPGRALKTLGARGTDTGVPEAVGDIMPGGGTIQGASKIAHGVGRTLQGHPIQGTNEVVRGAGQAMAPALAVTQPEFLPTAVEYGALGAGLEKTAKSLGFGEDTSEFLGNILTGMLGGKKALKRSDEKTVGKLSYAGGAGTTVPIEATLGDIAAAVKEKGIFSTIGDFMGVVKTAKDRLNTEYANTLGPKANQSVVPTTVSQRIRQLITPNMQKTASGQREIAAIKAAATEFEKPWTWGELDTERMNANARLYTYESKSPVDQYMMARKTRSVEIDKAIADSIRESIYPMMDKAAGKPSGYFANLKGRIGNLMELESKLTGRIEKLHETTAMSKGAPPMERARIRANVGESGGPRFWMSNLLGAIHAPSPEAQANKAVRGAFKESSPNPLIWGLPIKALLAGDVTDDTQDQKRKGVAKALTPIETTK